MATSLNSFSILFPMQRHWSLENLLPADINLELGMGKWLHTWDKIGKTPVRIILWCPTTKMLIKAYFLIQPLEQEGGGGGAEMLYIFV